MVTGNNTKLQIIAVMFTFSFGTSFAAEYNLDDCSKAYSTEKTNQSGYLATAKTKALNEASFTGKDGFDSAFSTTDVNYQKAAFEAAIDAVIGQLKLAMDNSINDRLNDTSVTYPVSDPDVTNIVAEAAIDDSTNPLDGVKVSDALVAGALASYAAQVVNAEGYSVIAATQAPVTKKYVEEKIEAAAAKIDEYPTTGTLSEADKLMQAVDTAKASIKNAATNMADPAAQAVEYQKALLTFESTLGTINTKEDEAIANGTTNKDVSTAINTYVSELCTEVAAVNSDLTKVITVEKADYATTGYVDATGIATVYAPYIVKKGTSATKNITVFGVAVADLAKVTRSEAVAVNDAAYAEISSVGTVLKKSGLSDSDILALFATGTDIATDDEANIAMVKLINDTPKAYEAVVAAGEELKAKSIYGIKEYDDAKVDEAVKKVEDTVYAEFGTHAYNTAGKITTAAAMYYIDNSGVDVKAKNFENDKFKAAIKTNVSKMFETTVDPTEALGFTVDKTSRTALVKYGTTKTADEDVVYLSENYYDPASTDWNYDVWKDAWYDIASDAVDDLMAAQSYDEIEKIMAQVKEDLAKIMLDADASEMEALVDTTYADALDAYKDQAYALADHTKYAPDTYNDAKAQGLALLDKAPNKAEAAKAFEEAKKIIDTVKPTAEITAAEKAVNDAVNALPYTANITAADEEAVMAAEAAREAYADIPGAKATLATDTLLAEKVQAVMDAKVDALNKDTKALNDEIKALKLPTNLALASDDAIIALAKLADQINAVADAVDAIDDQVDAIEAVTQPDLTTAYSNAGNIADVLAIDVNTAKAIAADRLAVIANKDGATEEQIKAAVEAYNALTDAQKYALDEDYFETMKAVNAKYDAIKGFDAEAVKAALQDMSIVARSTKLSSGKIKVTVKADAQEIIDNGYTVKYKFFVSTKSSKKGYTSKIEKTTKSFTTSGKKGCTNYWKVTVKVYDADGNLVAKTPLTQCRYACRTL